MRTRLLFILGILFWSSNYVIGRLVVGVIPPLTLSYARWVLSALIFFPFCRNELRENAAKIKANWPSFLFLGATGYLGFSHLQYLAVKYTTAINANIINASLPMFTALGAYFVFKNKISGNQVMGIVLSFSGVAWVITNGNLEQLLALSFNRGDLFMLGALLINTVYVLSLRKKGSTVPPNSLYFCCVLGGLLVSIPVPAIEISQAGWGWVSRLNFLHFLALLYFAVFPAILSMLFYNRAIVELGPVKSSIYTNLGIVFTSILGMIFLDERLASAHLLGGGLIVVGAWLTNRRTEKESKNYFVDKHL